MGTLDGKVALVTGASRGIGAGVARVLARHGANVAVNYLRAKDKAEEVRDYIKSIGRDAIVIQANVMEGSDVRHMVDVVERDLGPVDILVNNAGHNPVRNILEIEERDWDWVLGLNLKSYFLCSKVVLPGMIDRGSGRIVNITSISGQRGGLSGDVDYSAAKAGIMGFTRALARWAAPRGVIVNAIAPGYIETDALLQLGESRVSQLAQTVPLKRLGNPEEIGEVVAFLVGPGGNYIVGEVISVNGGVHIA